MDPFFGVSWIRIRIRNTDPDLDPHMQILVKMEAKDVRFKILPVIDNSETQPIKKILGDSLFLGQNPGSGSKFNVFGSTTLLRTL